MKTSLCRFCGSEINKRRKWQEFCSDQCRWRQWSETHPRTARGRNDEAIAPCYYCGLPGSSIDHIPPVSLRSRLAELGLSQRFEFVEVNACHECNIALSARGLYTKAVRKRFIKAWLRKRYKRLLRIPTWSDQELAKLGYTLRTSVLSSILAAEVTKARLEW